jgi:hypothetical protein
MKEGRFHEEKRAAPRDRGIRLDRGDASTASAAPPAPLEPPVSGGIPVAFLVSDGAVIIDFCGPWEVFQDVQVGEERGPHHVGLHRRFRAREQRSALGEVS